MAVWQKANPSWISFNTISQCLNRGARSWVSIRVKPTGTWKFIDIGWYLFPLLCMQLLMRWMVSTCYIIVIIVQWLMKSFFSSGLGAALILNDDVEGAEAALDKGRSTFHKVHSWSLIPGEMRWRNSWKPCLYNFCFLHLVGKRCCFIRSCDIRVWSGNYASRSVCLLLL